MIYGEQAAWNVIVVVAEAPCVAILYAKDVQDPASNLLHKERKSNVRPRRSGDPATTILPAPFEEVRTDADFQLDPDRHNPLLPPHTRLVQRKPGISLRPGIDCRDAR